MNYLKFVVVPLISAYTFFPNDATKSKQSFIDGSTIFLKDTVLSKKQVDDWYKKKEWLGGLSATPHTSIDKEEFFKQYHAHKAWWDMAFAYMKNTDFSSLKPGKYLLDGDNVYVNVADGPTKTLDQAKYESHKDYADIHYLITGKEQISAADVSKGTIVQPYDDDKDIQFLTAKGKDYIAEPGSFFIFFPKTAHRPSVKTAGADTVKKIVVKIKVIK